MSIIRTFWETHDFKVKMLDWSAARGSRLAYTCRFCGRRFCCFTIHNRGAWATDCEGRPLESTVSDRWLSEQMPPYRQRQRRPRPQTTLQGFCVKNLEPPADRMSLLLFNRLTYLSLHGWSGCSRWPKGMSVANKSLPRLSQRRPFSVAK